jgi:cardiolipin synthase (CMP-forming)
MNIPNSLTILRILLIPVYVGFMTYGKYGLALLALLLAGMTDAVDGALARRMNQRTQLGAILDPLADKLVPSWLVILVVSRDVILLLGTAVAHVTNVPIDITPTFLGKGTTLLQLTYILLVVLMKWRGIGLSMLTPLLIVMVVFTLASGLHYLYRGYRHTNAASPLN